MNEQNDLTSLTDRDRPITTDLRHLSLTANNITAKLTNQCIQDDDFRSGCRNVRCHYRQQSFSGLHSPGRSNYTITERKSKQHTSCSSLYQVRRFPTSEKEIGKGAKKWVTENKLATINGDVTNQTAKSQGMTNHTVDYESTCYFTITGRTVPPKMFWLHKRRMISQTHNSSCYLKHLLVLFF